ncbi:MAG: hypothetical protein NDI82_03270 [Anaeromyxobacteraceae bacterium]|nr:hypothetical protein [Anaeromyxobacteraceae bacterium]
MRIDRKRLEHLTSEVSRAWQLAENGKEDEGLDLARTICAELERAGRSSAFALWHVGLIANKKGDLEMAYDFIARALEADPVAAPLRKSFGGITHRIRGALAAEERTAADPSTPKLYDLLVRAGEADLGCHLAMVRWCAATGDHARARVLADAMTTLHPLERASWLTSAAAARAAGDHELAARATAEAAALEGDPVPFALQEVARG